MTDLVKGTIEKSERESDIHRISVQNRCIYIDD